ncbi:DUF3094 family protein [Pseudoteredinibacter isoporae]|uniref:DUF3094 domain-containing protein n=1 Tax=Pseudoteredinibacter isoporae TaxID=570281 RepID=A0A7X0MWM7_9GAMM|nr:DUF3094 family protein [Pseudoteredinibacter isoporae]MBB6521104.1 hypothetical protein [Pseudoteredinibacter isoporae]NHO86668.1 DUF3094 family protein [Pseudoteredinibacter isoporae]NIB24880.1 DUF3094 family protein [Pseudoteredinibacter isoporae]
MNNNDEPKLSPEDQAKVDKFVSTGVNSVERKPFRPLYLLVMVIIVLTILSGVSYWIAMDAGLV